MKYRKKPVIIEATQWFKNGDHPNDYDKPVTGINEKGAYIKFTPNESKQYGWEGQIVKYFRKSDLNGRTKCMHCGSIMHVHGWIDTLEGGHVVCPRDWIITGVVGEMYPCKPDIFFATYELVV